MKFVLCILLCSTLQASCKEPKSRPADVPAHFLQVQALQHPHEATPWHLLRLSNGVQWKEVQECHVASMKRPFERLETNKQSIVYLLDTGAESSNPEFEGRVVLGPSFEPFKERSPDQTSNDLHGRGTFIAGLITGRNFGVSRAKVIAIKVADRLGNTAGESVIKGIDYAVDEIRKANQTRISTICIPDSRLSKLSEDLKLWNIRDIPIVISAGNRHSASSLPDENNNLIRVGAIDSKDSVWRLTERRYSKVYAPGVDIKSTTSQSNDKERRPIHRTGTEYAAGIVCGLSAYFQSLDLSDEPAWKIIEKLAISPNENDVKIVQSRA